MDIFKELTLKNMNSAHFKLATHVAHIQDKTPLMCVFENYGLLPTCDAHVLHKFIDYEMLLMISDMLTYKFKIKRYTDCFGLTELMYAFLYYGPNPNCDHNIFLRMLDMDCKPHAITKFFDMTALMYAFKYYGTNPNCDPRVFLKLILLLDPETSKSELITLLNTNTENQILKNKILGLYNYGVRRTIINNRISKRVKLGKRDSMHLF